MRVNYQTRSVTQTYPNLKFISRPTLTGCNFGHFNEWGETIFYTSPFLKVRPIFKREGKKKKMLKFPGVFANPCPNW